MSAPIRRLSATPFRQLVSKLPSLECPRGRAMLYTRETGQATNSANKDLSPSLPETVCSGCHRPLPTVGSQCHRPPPKLSGTTMPRNDPFDQTGNVCFFGAIGIMSGVYVVMYTYYPPFAEAKARKSLNMPPQNQFALSRGAVRSDI